MFYSIYNYHIRLRQLFCSGLTRKIALLNIIRRIFQPIKCICTVRINKNIFEGSNTVCSLLLTLVNKAEGGLTEKMVLNNQLELLRSLFS